MIDMALLEPVWQGLLQTYGTALTSLAALPSPSSPGRVQLALGLDRPDLPRYAAATPVTLAKLALPLGIPAVQTSVRQQGLEVEGLRYNAGRFTRQGVTINVHQGGAHAGAACQKPPPAEGTAVRPWGTPGESIGAVGASTGSVCVPVRVNGSWTHLLSCAHVIAPRVMAPGGSPPATYMPGPADAVWQTTDLETVRAGCLDRYVRGYDAQGHALADAALARCERPLEGPAFVPDAGRLRRVVQPRVGEQVRLRGRRTPAGAGSIVADTCLVHVDGCTERHFLRATYASLRGDSGGLLYRTTTDGIVGLGMHVGRELDHAYFLPLQLCLDALVSDGLDAATGSKPTTASSYCLT
jgi:hypothetical protein